MRRRQKCAKKHPGPRLALGLARAAHTGLAARIATLVVLCDAQRSLDISVRPAEAYVATLPPTSLRAMAGPMDEGTTMWRYSFGEAPAAAVVAMLPAQLAMTCHDLPRDVMTWHPFKSHDMLMEINRIL